jgi:hypothetical protein
MVLFNANLELQSGTSQSLLYPGAGGCGSKRAGSSVDVLAEDRRRSAAAGDGQIQPARIGGYTVEPQHLGGDRKRQRVGDQQLRVLGFPIELDQPNIGVSANVVSGLLAQNEHFVDHHWTPLCGHELQLNVQLRHIVAVAAVNLLLCQSPALSYVCVGALPLSHRTETRPSRGSGSGVWLLPSGVQRRAARSRCGVSGRGETFGHRGAATGDHPGQNHSGAGLACRGSECGVSAVGQRCASGVSQFLRLLFGQAQRPPSETTAVQVAQGSSAVVSAHSQWVPCAIERAIAPGKGRRGARTLVAPVTQPTIFGHDHPRARRPLLRELRRRHASLPVTDGEARSGDRCRDRAPSDDRHYRRTVPGSAESEASAAQDAQAPASGAGEISTREGIKQQGQNAAQGCHSAWHGCSCPARLSPQAGPGVGTREPSDPCRGPQYRGHGSQSPASAGDLRRGLGAVHAGHRRESHKVRPYIASSLTLVGIQQDVLGVRASPRGAHASGPGLEVSCMWHGTRSRPQRRQSHSRRRAGGEIKRFPHQWAGPRLRLGWSPGKSFNLGGAGR